MRWFRDPCGRFRESICLLTSGALPDEDKTAVEAHLAICAPCRKYCEELRALTVPLANWERTFAHIKPNKNVEIRLSEMNRQSAPIREFTFAATVMYALATPYRELIWPARRIWAGFALVWLVIAAVNLADSDRAEVAMSKSKVPQGGMVLAWEQEQKLCRDLLDPPDAREAENLKALPPKPRSDRQPKQAMG
jgi:anti-sigma factor RsiW